MYKVPSQAYQDQKDSAMILVAGGNQQAPVHPEGMDGGWTGKHFFIEFLFTSLPGWSPQLLFLLPTLLTTHSRNQCSGLFLHKKKHFFCVPWYSEGQNNQQKK
jgi:hypothetical protein